MKQDALITQRRVLRTALAVTTLAILTFGSSALAATDPIPWTGPGRLFPQALIGISPGANPLPTVLTLC